MEELIDKKKTINGYILLFLLIPFFKPDIVTSFPKVNYIFTIWLMISFAIIVAVYMKKFRISKLTMTYLAYNLVHSWSFLLNKALLLVYSLAIAPEYGLSGFWS